MMNDADALTIITSACNALIVAHDHVENGHDLDATASALRGDLLRALPTDSDPEGMEHLLEQIGRGVDDETIDHVANAVGRVLARTVRDADEDGNVVIANTGTVESTIVRLVTSGVTKVGEAEDFYAALACPIMVGHRIVVLPEVTDKDWGYEDLED